MVVTVDLFSEGTLFFYTTLYYVQSTLWPAIACVLCILTSIQHRYLWHCYFCNQIFSPWHFSVRLFNVNCKPCDVSHSKKLFWQNINSRGHIDKMPFEWGYGNTQGQLILYSQYLIYENCYSCNFSALPSFYCWLLWYNLIIFDDAFSNITRNWHYIGGRFCGYQQILKLQYWYQ